MLRFQVVVELDTTGVLVGALVVLDTSGMIVGALVGAATGVLVGALVGITGVGGATGVVVGASDALSASMHILEALQHLQISDPLLQSAVP